MKWLWIILGIYAVASVVAFVAYGLDKLLAVQSGRQNARRPFRLAEQTLHFIELMGGWPGAYVAQRAFKHKWRKREYMRVYWCIVALHAAAWIGWVVWR